MPTVTELLERGVTRMRLPHWNPHAYLQCRDTGPWADLYDLTAGIGSGDPVPIPITECNQHTDWEPALRPYYLTFGQQYAREPHPAWPGAHPDGWVEIRAENYDQARDYAVAAFGTGWCWLYQELSDLDPDLFTRGRLALLDDTGLHEEVAP